MHALSGEFSGGRLPRRTVARIAAVTLIAGLAGCVSGAPTPSQDLLGVLSPTQFGNQSVVQNEAEIARTGVVAPPTSSTGTNTATASSGAQTLALSNTQASSAPSSQAANALANADRAKIESPDNKSITSASVEPAPAIVAKIVPTAKPASTGVSPAAAPKASVTSGGNFFTRLFKSNEAGNTSAKVVSKRPKVSVQRRKSVNGALPGVRSETLFGIEGNPEYEEPIELASLTNMARRGNFGLLLQTPKVKVSCFPPKLVRILKMVERKYGRTPIVTSGYRSPRKNRRIRGARNSTHISCKAADIQVKGISKWTLAKYLRSIPGRGGVGTYCHTKSVHIDIGKKRDWNWRCRRKRKRKA